MNDIGLLTATYGFELKAYIVQKTLKGSIKGGIYENLISDILTKRGYKLNYYKLDNNAQEIEFLITTADGGIPIEVKSGNEATVSLNNYMEVFKPACAYKLIDGNVGKTGVKITLPLYMAAFI